MPLHDEVCLVQFIHPGPEPNAIENGRINWNSGDDHERRFVQTRGECRNSRGGRFEGPLRLWCEWEAQSFVKRINDHPAGGLPECLHRPFYVRIAFMPISAKYRSVRFRRILLHGMPAEYQARCDTTSLSG